MFRIAHLLFLPNTCCIHLFQTERKGDLMQCKFLIESPNRNSICSLLILALCYVCAYLHCWMSDTHFHVSLFTCFESTLFHFQSSSTAAQSRGSESLAGNRFPRKMCQTTGEWASPLPQSFCCWTPKMEPRNCIPYSQVMLRQLLGPCFLNRCSREAKCFYRKCHFLLPYF